MFHSLHCTVVNPFVAGSSVLFTFIGEHFKKWLESVDNQYILVRRLSAQMAAQILKRERAKEFLLKSHSKKLEATSFNNIN